ncbi:MAG: bacillithiol biosynthesis cysteine-adding enzyme BshC [Cyanobacteria bacterium]|nr:bacillithiol biosynthesis cysteine-adding enzyme BshC [Cyanobacteriota bacterium]
MVDSLSERLRQYVPVPADVSTAAASSLAVDIRTFPWIRRLASDYAFAFANVAPFFAGDPATPAAWADTIKRSQGFQRQPAEIAKVIAAQQAQRNAPPAAREAGARLADPATRVVITGQQAGLFGGPLFTLLKAITTMKLAAHVSREHRVPVVPVFWIDAEDHDWPEVSGCTVLDSEFAPTTVRLADLPGAGTQPIARLSLNEDIHAALDQLNTALPDTEFKAELLTALREAYTPGRSMAAAFGVWMEHVLGPHGLVVYDSSDPTTKALARDVFVKEVSQPGETARIAAKAGDALVAKGYHAQAQLADGTVSLFHLNSGREAIRIDGNTATIGEHSMTVAQLAEEARRHPEHFSPNVLLRPLVQDTVFPTICYVAGPNELAYLGQLKGVYAHFGVPMPLFYQRGTATLAESATLRFLSKYDLPITALRAQDESALNQLLESQLPPTVEQSLASLSSLVDERMAAVAAAVPQIDPTLEGAVKSTLGKMQHEVQTLHNKVIQAAKRRDETLRRQFQRAQALTFPQGHPQEREVGFVWFVNRYGPALVDRLMEELPLPMGYHWVLTI